MSIYLLTGLMASGKSTVGELLAGRFARGVHLRGDVFRRMIVSGREDMRENPPPEALAQLDLRYRLSAQSARMYAESGFTVVLQDNYYGEALPRMLSLLEGCRVQVTVLCPDCETIALREQARGKKGYTGFAVRPLYDMFMRETPRVGYWLDNARQTPEQTAEAIYRHFAADGEDT